MTYKPHSSHWGAFSAAVVGDRIDVVPHPDDPCPSPILDNLRDAPGHRSRVRKPAFRKGWLDGGPGPDTRRGSDGYVELEWDEAIPLIAAELTRVEREYGPGRVFGGSYGWSSAGRFHHAQSQVHRFLNTALGGYVSSYGTYSAGAAQAIMPHVIGGLDKVARTDDLWGELATTTELVVAFGGMPVRNAMVSAGGVSRHVAMPSMTAAHRRGARFVMFSPLRDDMPAEVEAEWHANLPLTDTAIMLGLAHVLITEGLADRAFLDRYCVGFDRLADYVTGKSDGVAKTPEWAQAISGIGADALRELARAMAARRTLVTVSNSLQRAEFGEQPVWMGIALAALTGQIGQPGGGFSYSLGAIGNVGKRALGVPIPTLNQGKNGVGDFIPVARITDLLLNPGATLEFNGKVLTYPDIRLVYWAGGNPFHHHQDLSRLRAGFARPDTIIVHEQFWTATARHADIVLPATMTLERDDIGASQNDTKMIAMKQVVAPQAGARDDFEIFADLAGALGRRDAFTGGRTQREWLAEMYEPTRAALAALGRNAPSFEEFWEQGEIELPTATDPGLVRGFVQSPETAPLPTPSGRIELFSDTIAGFGYADCAGHPKWFEPVEWLGGALAGTYPLQLVANQPANRLHSQLDFGAASAGRKLNGREVARIHPDDARARSIATGDTVRLFNGRGACLATAVVTEDVRPRVVQLSTGAWFTPAGTDDPTCLQGNPNVLTRDVGTSRLAQGCCGQLTLVDVERFDGEAPAVDPYAPPLGRG